MNRKFELALTSDDTENICREIRDDINDLVSAINGITNDINEVRIIIADAENLLIDLRVTLSSSNNAEFLRKIRLEIMAVERTRDNAKQKLFELEAAHEGLSRQLSTLQDQASANGC